MIPPLRPLQKEDLHHIARMRCDPAITQRLVGHNHSMSAEGASRWYDFYANNPASHALRAITDEKGAPIGYARLRTTDPATRRADYAIVIGDPDYWGRGIGRSTTSWFLALGFQCMGLLKVELSVLSSNKPALSLYEKLGFQVEGTVRNAALRSGAFEDVVAMGILASEWARPKDE